MAPSRRELLHLDQQHTRGTLKAQTTLGLLSVHCAARMRRSSYVGASVAVILSGRRSVVQHSTILLTSTLLHSCTAINHALFEPLHLINTLNQSLHLDNEPFLPERSTTLPCLPSGGSACYRYPVRAIAHEQCKDGPHFDITWAKV